MKKWVIGVVIVVTVSVILVFTVGGRKPVEEPPIRFNTLSEVKCDGEEYSLAVKPENAVVLLLTSNVREHNIDELKLSGLVQELYEIGRTVGDSEGELVVHAEEWYGTTMLMELPYQGSCKVAYMADLPSENRDALLQKIQDWGDYTYLLLSSPWITRDKDARLSFTGRFEG